MPVKINSEPGFTRCYQITVEGKMDASWSDWLGSLQMIPAKKDDGTPVTLLRGNLTDQAALRGLLNRLWDLNLVVCSVIQINESLGVAVTGTKPPNHGNSQ